MVFVHGGGFQAGDRNAQSASRFLDTLAKVGIVSASISYRLSMKGRGFGCDIPVSDKRRAVAMAGEDLESALSWLQNQQHRTEWPERWVAAGSSAGAETVMWSGYVNASDRWAGIVSFSGAVDATALPDSSDPPLLAIHGQCDELVPAGRDVHHFCSLDSPGAWKLIGGPAWANALRSVGVPATTWIQCEGGHMVCNSAMDNSSIVDLIIEWIESRCQNEQDVVADHEGRPVQPGHSSCPQPCN